MGVVGDDLAARDRLEILEARLHDEGLVDRANDVAVADLRDRRDALREAGQAVAA